ncbi:hypothetical protein NJC40_25315 [Pseudomonas sp. 21LCFQ02]|uniref:PA3496 family putative envelope integrity protein n=1 Tax=unclassified Pseudomonas TaxID=196821 RepID=UPI0004F85D57|nr:MULTISPECIES: hypothetical protein [unclassified Pseudomonas]MCO8165629.1 hypothetical protein [Pseudomonas sp. 21LCFQ010]MCO8171093.1 hypothetical protein [Pseudomonas sp. 21LCFQ02]MCQ9426925.1 hypothetical protein [Pseudomonas sp. LJDD11]BAP42532.1 hypothetical protein PSCI_1830 [Pseudomonas sp. StFLB209]
MARHYDDIQNSAVKTRRQQEDQRRMAFRRAIETYSEERRLTQSLGDYIDDVPDQLWQVSLASSDRRSARPAG